MPLTDRQIKALKPREKQYKVSDERGLCVVVAPAGGKWWRLNYRYQGKQRTLSMGTYPDTSLALAREKRDEARQLLARGIDPSAQRKAEKESLADSNSFEALTREWLATRKDLHESTRTLAQERLERWALPYLGPMAARQITPADVLKVLRPIEAAGKHETAHRVRQRISQIMRYGIITGRVDSDPCRDLKGALTAAKTRQRAAVTDPREVGELMRALHGYSGQPATRAALQILALTFVRPGELRNATWDELDLDGAMWRIPGHRMKMDRPHAVPLSRQAVEAFRWLQPITIRRPFVFEGVRRGRPISENTMTAALRTMGYSGDQMTAHGFRAMASTLLHELGWPPEVIELQLAHAQRNQVAAAYNRSARLPDRTKMMQTWADYLDELKAN